MTTLMRITMFFVVAIFKYGLWRMGTFEEAFAKFPPSVPSRCYHKTCIDPTCPKCPISRPSVTGTSAVHFQLKYTCDSATYSPCYFPRVIRCPPPWKQPIGKVSCNLKWLDCCGNPVPKRCC